MTGWSPLCRTEGPGADLAVLHEILVNRHVPNIQDKKYRNFTYIILYNFASPYYPARLGSDTFEKVAFSAEKPFSAQGGPLGVLAVLGVFGDFRGGVCPRIPPSPSAIRFSQDLQVRSTHRTYKDLVQNFSISLVHYTCAAPNVQVLVPAGNLRRPWSLGRPQALRQRLQPATDCSRLLDRPGRHRYDSGTFS
eukprot:SAG11_NODE_12_length_27025_cov_37.402681_23_plen_193_part_00